MRYYLLDLEWNSAYSKRHGRFVNEIIEIGAVRLNDRLEEAGEFTCFVRPKLSGKLTRIVRGLTSLSLEDLQDGMEFEQAIARFSDWIGTGEQTVLTWSNTDLHVLLDNCHCFLKRETIPFLEKYVDLQRYAQEALQLSEKNQVGLSQAAQLLDIDLENQIMHRALGDSRICGEIFRKVYNPQTFMPFVMDAHDRMFYKRLTHKNEYITNLNCSEINQNDLRFHCEDCGRFARRISKWTLRNKSFRAQFACRTCKRKFYGQIRFKRTFDEIITKRSTYPCEPDKIVETVKESSIGS